MDTTSKINKIAIAFTYILLGLVIISFPDKGAGIKITKLISWIFIIIGQSKLVYLLNGKGRTGAILLLIASLIQVTIRINSLSVFSFNLLPEPNESMSTINLLDSLLKITRQDAPGPLWANLLQNALLMSAMMVWLSYEPFIKAKSSIMTLLVLYLLLFILDSPLTLSTRVPSSSILLKLMIFVSIIAYIGIVKSITASPRPTYGILLLYIGFLYTLLMLVDNSIKTSLLVIAGAITFLIGNGKLRALSDRAGTRAFNCYGVLMILAGGFMMIPVVGGVVATIVQVCSYLIAGIGFIKFSNNQIFDASRANGMIFAGCFVLANIILAFIPTSIEAGVFLFCLIEIPLLLIVFKQGVNAVQL